MASSLIHGVTAVFGGKATGGGSDITNVPMVLSVGNVLTDAAIQNPTSIDVVGDTGIVGSISNGVLSIIDFSDRTPKFISSILIGSTTQNQPFGVKIKGDFAFMSGNSPGRLTVVDISDKTIPVIVKQIDDSLLNGGEFITINGDYLYVGSAISQRFNIIDISNPIEPIIISSIDNSNFLDIADVAVRNDIAYCVTNTLNKIISVDISDKVNPVIITTKIDGVNLKGANRITLRDNFAVVSCGSDNRLTIVDITQPDTMNILGSLKDDVNLLGVSDIEVVGLKVLAGNKLGDSVSIIDISNLTAPVFSSTLVDAINLNGIGSIRFVDGNTIAVATAGGVTIVNLAGAGIDTANIRSLSVDVLDVKERIIFPEPVVKADSYAEMFVAINSTAAVVFVVNLFQYIVDPVIGLLKNFSFIEGASSTFTAAISGQGGNAELTDTTHNLIVGDFISLHLSSNYDGLSKVIIVSATTFTINRPFVADDSGSYLRGAGFKALKGSEGKYLVNIGITDTATTANQLIRVQLSINGVLQNKLRFGRTLGNNETGIGGGTGIFNIKENDSISLLFRNETTNANIIIKDSNVNMTRIST